MEPWEKDLKARIRKFDLGQSDSSATPPVDKPWYEEAYDWTKETVLGSEATADLERRNIDTSTWKNFRRVWDASAGPDEEDRLIQYYNQNPDLEFRIDKTGRLLQLPPGEEQWSVINAPGLDPSDIAEMGGELSSMAGGTIGLFTGRNIANLLNKYKGLGGKKFKFLAGLAGMIYGAKEGGERQITLAEESGQLAHLTPEEIKKKRGWSGHPGKMALSEGLGALGGRIITGAAKKLWTMARGVDIPKSMRERALNIPENMPIIIEEVNAMLKAAGINKKFSPDSARILNDPEFMSAVIAIERGGGEAGHRIVRQLYGNNQDALREFLELISKKQELPTTTPIPGKASPELQVGETIQTAVRQEIGEGEEAVLKAAQDAASGELATRTGVESAGGVSYRELGEILRPEVKAVYDDLVASMKLQFEGLEKEVLKTQPKFMPANTLRVATELQEKLGGGPAKGTILSEGEDKLVQTIRENVLSHAGKGMATPLTYTQMNEYIRLLRKGIRRSQRGQAIGAGLDLDVLHKLESAAVLDKMNRLKGMPEELAQKHLDLDKAYTAQKTLLEAKGVQNIVGWDVHGPKIQDQQLFAKIFGPDKGPTMGAANDLISLMEKGSGVGNFEAIKRSIVEEFLNKTTRAGTKEIDGGVAQQWLSRHKDSLKQWLSDDEIKTLADAKDSGKLLANVRARGKTFEADMKEIFGDDFINISETNSAEIFERAWKDASTIQQHKQILQDKYPHIWEQLYNTGLENIKKELVRPDKNLKGLSVVSYDVLKRKLGDYKWVDKVRLTYGDEYVGNLTKLMEASEILARAIPLAPKARPNAFVEMIGKVFFGPLDHRRFAMKALTKYAADQQSANFQSIVLNPAALNHAAKQMTTSEFAKQTQQILGGKVAVVSQSGDQYESDAAKNAVNQLRRDINIPGNPRLREKIQRALSAGP